MKKLLVLSFAISILFFACSENTNLVDPLDQRSNNAAQAIQPLKTNLAWMSLPSTKSSKFLGETQVTGEQVIDLTVGGDVTAFYASADGRTTISAKLHVPIGALTNVASLRFYMLIDNEKLSIKFEPHPTYFDIPLTLDLEYTGVNLSGIDPSKIYFAYLDDPATGFIISNDHIFTDLSTGTLRITGGKIPHFSEYGFVR